MTIMSFLLISREEITDKSEGRLFITNVILKRLFKNAQFIVHMFWFRHPVSLLKQTCYFPAIHPWIWGATYTKILIYKSQD